MKKEEAWESLIKCLDNDKFLIHNDFITDMKILLSSTLRGQEKNFFNLFVKQLSYILNLSEYDVSMANGNEILKYCKDFDCYSLHIASKVFNIRLLGTFRTKRFIFLVAFNEKSGKKKTDYSSYILTAITRLVEIEEENYDE